MNKLLPFFVILALMIGINTAYAQTGVVHKFAETDAEVYKHGCIDDAALEEFYKADRAWDIAHIKALKDDELCFYVVGLQYSLIENHQNSQSRIGGGTSDVRVYTDNHPALREFGSSIELVVPNKYLRNLEEEKTKRHTGYTVIDGLIPYKIWKQSEFGTEKISFDVLVPVIDGRLPTEKELGAISKYIVGKEKKHKRSFVAFYLPEMEIDAGAFATAHHNPTMDVNIQLFMLYQYPEYKKFAQ